MKPKFWFILAIVLAVVAGGLYCAHVFLVKPAICSFYLGKAGVDIKHAKYTDARQALDIASKVSPNDPRPYVLLGDLELDDGNHEKALQMYDQAIRLDSNCAAAYDHRAYCRQRRKDITGAVQDYNLAIKYGASVLPLDASFYNRGLCHEDLKEDKDAIADYTESIKLNPNRPEVYLSRSSSYYRIGDYKRAMTDADAAVDHSPNYAYAYLIRGQFRSELCDEEGALADYELAVEKDPSLLEARVMRGNKYLLRGEAKKADVDLQRVLDAKAKTSTQLISQAFASYLKNDLKKSLNSCDRALAKEPAYCEGFCTKAMCYFGLRDYENCLTAADQALAVKPYGYAYETRVLALWKLKKYDEALASTKEWIKRLGYTDITASDASLMQAVLYRRKGDEASAKQALKDYVEKGNPPEWYKQTAEYFAGSFPEKDYLKTLVDPEKKSTYNFFFALDKQARGQAAQARPNWQWLKDNMPAAYPEHVMAVDELEKK